MLLRIQNHHSNSRELQRALVLSICFKLGHGLPSAAGDCTGSKLATCCQLLLLAADCTTRLAGDRLTAMLPSPCTASREKGVLPCSSTACNAAETQ